MIKVFCGVCYSEINSSEVNLGRSGAVLQVPVSSGVQLDIISESTSTSHIKVDICKNCAFDAIYKLDSRTKEK